jgi:hypothetical protein
MQAHAKYLYGQGRASFFIRIEDIDTNFETAFEVGDNTQFIAWLNSSEKAWFFLDSVDVRTPVIKGAIHWAVAPD